METSSYCEMEILTDNLDQIAPYSVNFNEFNFRFHLMLNPAKVVLVATANYVAGN